MSATAYPETPDLPSRRERREERRRERRWREESRDPRQAGRWSPWTAPKGILIAAMVVGFIAFFPIGLFILGFMIGAGRLGRRWAERRGMLPATNPEAGSAWASTWCGAEARGTSGNSAFDEYREDTLRRLEEEQKDFSAFLERLRFAKDRAEFEQFMTDRRGRANPPEPEASQG